MKESGKDKLSEKYSKRETPNFEIKYRNLANYDSQINNVTI